MGAIAMLVALSACGRVQYLAIPPDAAASSLPDAHTADAAMPPPDARSCGDLVRFDEVGSGTEAAPFLVCNEAQLRSLAEVGEPIHVALTEDVVLSDTPFTPIGGALGWTGVFEGRGHSIRGLRVAERAGSRAGLFGGADGATIRALTLEELRVEGGNRVGALVGSGSRVTIEDVSIQGTVVGDLQVGGLAGQLLDSTVRGVRATVSVEARDRFAAGLIGRQLRGSVERVHVLGDVRISAGPEQYCRYVAGLVADLDSGTIRASAAEVTLTNPGGVTGGIVAWDQLGIVTDVYTTGSARGGIAGVAAMGMVDPERYFCSVLPWSYVGGVVGASLGGDTQRAWSSMTLSAAASNIGGIVAQNITLGMSRGRVASVFAATPIPSMVASGAVAELLDADAEEVWWDTRVIARQCAGSCRRLSTGAGIDTAARPDYFQLRANPPLSSWDFDAVWVERMGDFPTIRGLP